MLSWFESARFQKKKKKLFLVSSSSIFTIWELLFDTVDIWQSTPLWIGSTEMLMKCIDFTFNKSGTRHNLLPLAYGCHYTGKSWIPFRFSLWLTEATALKSQWALLYIFLQAEFLHILNVKVLSASLVRGTAGTKKMQRQVWHSQHSQRCRAVLTEKAAWEETWCYRAWGAAASACSQTE